MSTPTEVAPPTETSVLFSLALALRPTAISFERPVLAASVPGLELIKTSAALASVETPNAERSTTAAVDNFMLVFLFNLLTFFIIGTIKLKNRLVIINDKKYTLALRLRF